MKDNELLDDIFDGNENTHMDIYKTAQMVVKDYMEKHSKKIDWVATELGTQKGYLYSQLDPKQTNKPLSIDRILDITKLTNDTRIIEVIAKEVGMNAIPKVDTSCPVVTMIHTLVDVASIENADVFRESKMALTDGKITQDEKQKLLKELHEAQIANAKLKAHIEALETSE
jgi:hypothetical protein